LDALWRSSGSSEPTRSRPQPAPLIASPATRLARGRHGRSCRRCPGSVPLALLSRPHSTRRLSPKRYDNRYEVEDHERMTSVRVLVGVLAVLLLAGFAAGCGLVSDQTKQEAKQKVEQKAKQAKQEAKKRVEAKGQQAKKKIEAKGQQAGQEVKKKVEAGQENLKKKVDDLKKKVEAGQEDVKKKVDTVQKDVNDLQKKVDEILKKVDAQQQQDQKQKK